MQVKVSLVSRITVSSVRLCDAGYGATQLNSIRDLYFRFLIPVLSVLGYGCNGGVLWA